MHLTPKELESIAANRYWRTKSKAIWLSFLIAINIIGLGFLLLYLTGGFPESTPLQYSLNDTTVTIGHSIVLLNGMPMQLTQPDTSPQTLLFKGFIALSIILLVGLLFYHYTKAQKYGRNLLEDTITKEKASGRQ